MLAVAKPKNKVSYSLLRMMTVMDEIQKIRPKFDPLGDPSDEVVENIKNPKWLALKAALS